MKAKTIKGKSIGEITSALADAMVDDFSPTLAFIFLSVKQNKDAIRQIFNDAGILIFGATTAGEFINDEVEDGTIAIMLLDMNPAYFKIEFAKTTIDGTLKDANRLGRAGKEAFSSPAFIIATGGLSLDGEQVVEGIVRNFERHQSSGNNGLALFGGKAGDDLALEASYVFTNAQSSDNAVVALIIDADKVDVRGIATCGWNAVGTTKTVTSSAGNTVYTIDDKPALDTLMNFLGVDIKDDGESDIVNFLSSWYYPLQVEREEADPVIRTAMFANKKDRSLICSGNVAQGSKIRFSLPPDFDSIDQVISDCRTIKDDAPHGADALIMFSCVSRYLSFGLAVKDEIEQVQKIWDAPMVGFFTYGEYGKSLSSKQKGIMARTEYHNNACCVVALKEK